MGCNTLALSVAMTCGAALACWSAALSWRLRHDFQASLRCAGACGTVLMAFLLFAIAGAR